MLGDRRTVSSLKGLSLHHKAVPLGFSGASKANTVPSPVLYRFCPSSCSHLREHTDMCSASQRASQGVLAPAHTSCWCHLLYGFQSPSPSSRAAMANRQRQGGFRTAKSNFFLGQVSRRPKSRGSEGQLFLVLPKVCVAAGYSQCSSACGSITPSLLLSHRSYSVSPYQAGHLRSFSLSPYQAGHHRSFSVSPYQAGHCRSFSVSFCILSHFLKKFSLYFHPIKT